jgi:hypothetical protein
MPRKRSLVVTSLSAVAGMLIISITLINPISNVHAQSNPASTQTGSFTGFGTCWSADCYVISTSAPYVDNGCGGTATAQYATAPGAAGNTTIHATLLGAFLSGKRVSLVVQGCVFGHPQIIGVGVAP